MSSTTIQSLNESVVSEKQSPCSKTNVTKVNERLKNRPHTYRNKLHGKKRNGLNNSCSSQLLLAGRSLKVNSQENEIRNLKQNIEYLNNENKIIRTQNLRQQKEIDRIQNQDLSMTNVFKQHEAEIFNLKEQVRKSRLSLSNEQKLRSDTELEVLNMKTALYKRQEIISESQLLEKFDTKRQLDNAQNILASKQIELEALMRQLENQDKNYKIEISNIQKQLRTCNGRCGELEAHVSFLKVSLKEKQKLLDIQNIYSNRINLSKLDKKVGGKTSCSLCLSKNDSEHYKCNSGISTKSVIDLPRMEDGFEYNKTNFEGSNQKKFKQFEIEKERSRIMKDIRKIIIQEIKQNKFAIFTNPTFCETEQRAISPINILITDLNIDSPIVTIENIDIMIKKDVNQKGKIQPEFDNKINNQLIEENLLIKSGSHLEKTEKKNVKMISYPDKINGKYNESKLPLKSKLQKEILQNIPEIPDSKISDGYLYPDNLAVVENDNWLKEIENISVHNKICETQSKRLKKEIIENVSVMNNSDKCNQPVESMKNLPQPIIDDLNDKKSVIDEKLKNNLIKNVIGKCESKIRGVRLENTTLKNSLQKFIFPKQSHSADITINQVIP